MRAVAPGKQALEESHRFRVRVYESPTADAESLLPRGHTFSDYPAASAALPGYQLILADGQAATRFVTDLSRFSGVDVGKPSSVSLVDGEKDVRVSSIAVG